MRKKHYPLGLVTAKQVQKEFNKLIPGMAEKRELNFYQQDKPFGDYQDRRKIIWGAARTPNGSIKLRLKICPFFSLLGTSDEQVFSLEELGRRLSGGDLIPV